MALIDDREPQRGSRSETDVRVVIIDHQSFLFLTRNDPMFALRIMKIITNGCGDSTRCYSDCETSRAFVSSEAQAACAFLRSDVFHFLSRRFA